MPEIESEERWRVQMRAIGTWAKRARLLCGLSQEELARRAQVSQGCVSRLERGDAIATPYRVVVDVHGALVPMLRALNTLDGTALADDAPGTADQTTLLRDEQFAQLVAAYRGTRPDHREQFVRIAVAAAGGAKGPAPAEGTAANA